MEKFTEKLLQTAHNIEKEHFQNVKQTRSAVIIMACNDNTDELVGFFYGSKAGYFNTVVEFLKENPELIYATRAACAVAAFSK